MRMRVLTAVAVGALTLAGSLPAQAGESTIELHRVGPKGVGPVIGTAVVSDAEGGIQIVLDLRDMPPGPNRFRLVTTNDCASLGGATEAASLPALNVETDEDGALPVKGKVAVANLSLEQMRDHALVVVRGLQSASSDAGLTGAHGVVACGVVQ